MFDIETWKQRKKSLHLTFEDIAQQSGISISTIKDIFRGQTTDPRIETVRAIERVLDLSEEFTPEERAAGFTDKRKVSITPIEDDMLYEFRQIGKKRGEEAQRALIAIAKNMQ